MELLESHPIGEPPAEQPFRGEHRWPVALAIAVAAGLLVVVPERLTIGPAWLIPVVVAILMVAVVLADPGRVNRVGTTTRVLSIALLVVLGAGAAFATARLVVELVEGGGVTNSASELLRAGAVVWIDNVIVFGLLYWELDAGGPAARLHRHRAYPDFAFPQTLNPDIAPPGWRPVFVDYLYVGTTNATAFSPTDAMPLAPWAKLTMAAQSMISILLLSLVIARAVNILH